MLVTLVYAPLLIILPVIIGGVLHTLAIKVKLFPGLAVPLSERWFGRHKTYRGFVLMPITCVIGVYVAMLVERHLPALHWVGFEDVSIVLGGATLGFGYMLFELPNSFLKRRLGVQEGALAQGRGRWLFLLADQVDSVIGCVLVCAVFLKVDVAVLAVTTVFGVISHTAINFALYLGGIRRRPI